VTQRNRRIRGLNRSRLNVPDSVCNRVLRLMKMHMEESCVASTKTEVFHYATPRNRCLARLSFTRTFAASQFENAVLSRHSTGRSMGAHSPVESSRVQSDSQRRGRLFGFLITTACRNVYTPARPSRGDSLESCRVKRHDAACSIFVSRTLLIGRGGCYYALENECIEVDSFSQGPPGSL
jgi:hypothetical protein